MTTESRVMMRRSGEVRPDAEWLEADGLGGFASGTVAGVRTRRYHALLLAAVTPPTGRLVLVSGCDAWIERPGIRPGEGAREFLTVQRYVPDVTAGGTGRIAAFTAEPWPAWTWRLADGLEIQGELFVPKGSAVVCLRWRCPDAPAGLRLLVRPFLSGRDAHALHHENSDARADADVSCARVRWQIYAGVPAVVSVTNGSYGHAPVWYRGFQLDEERARGFDFAEDAISPGVLSWDLSASEAVWMLGAEGQPGVDRTLAARPLEAFRALERSERTRRAAFPTRLHRAADAYLVARGTGRTIIAGYPWFTDWGRDTFIALRGLCLATGRLDEARDILEAWARTVSLGMLPNRFVDQGDAPEFNSVDASLWYVVACWEYLRAAQAAGRRVSEAERRSLESACWGILAGYATGTRYGIQMTEDGLLCSGEPGVQLTWMDAKVGDWVVTPRVGKPVEVQALWLNALRIGAMSDARWARLYNRGVESFRSRFWNPLRGDLYDVVDDGRVPGAVDATIRPNQIFA
ncbi:MAG TPA: amylo-alpha-1,6-glucosidase, partial [Gemmatimonadales bacterium]|nr:amylo-alpha-1,6-glucosidase [Gemmatimonadales bacterium]